jgi:hypothetical protein
LVQMAGTSGSFRAGADPEWMDRLVELHVLAESGDRDAAAEAARWMAADDAARRAWESVERTCDGLRS